MVKNLLALLAVATAMVMLSGTGAEAYWHRWHYWHHWGYWHPWHHWGYYHPWYWHHWHHWRHW